MAMRESAGSMRAYFLLAGILSALTNVGGLASYRSNLVAAALGGIGIVAAIAFIYIGVRLPALIASSSTIVARILGATGVWLVAQLLLGLVFGLKDSGPIVSTGIGLLIIWYLWRNFERLAREAASRASGV